MLGIDRRTGRTISGWEQFISRATQALTTQIGARDKRRPLGSRLPETRGQITGDSLLLLAQSHAIATFYNPVNRLGDFKPSRCVASRHATGLRLSFEGRWRGQSTSFEVPL